MKNKILMLGWELPPYNSGGLGVASYGLAKALSEKGYDITFLMPKKLNLKIDFMKLKFADIGKVDLLTSSYTHSSIYSKVFNLKNPTLDFVKSALLFGDRISDVIGDSDADIIHSHDWLTFPAGMSAKRTLRKPLVAHIHSTEIDRTGGIYPNEEVLEIEKAGLKSADKIIPVSGLTKDIIIKHYAIDPQKVEVVHNGVDIESKDLTPALIPLKKMGYKIVLFLGRITLQKGPLQFLKAAELVSRYYPKVLFVVAGSGDMQGIMMTEAVKLGIIDKTIFTGFLRGDDKDRIFRAADVYIMPSISEPFGITTLESIANGTPVIISKQSGVSEVLKNSLKVDFWDTEELANKIVSVLKHTALATNLVSESQKELPAINWNVAADKCIQVYRSLI